MEDPSDRRIAIIGAGPGGLCMAHRFIEAGFGDVTLYEQDDGVGGTWRRNRYPGCACDVPSALYSFSFAPKLDWSRPYGRQSEILGYFEDFATEFGLRDRCRFATPVVAARWHDDRAHWTLTLGGEAAGTEVDADVVVSALGLFNEPAWPNIAGRDDFGGFTVHTARWDADHDLHGERVGIIGSAASAVQLLPEVARQAASVHLFQRTANWVLPKEDDPYTEEQLAAFRADPSLMAAMRREIFERMEESGLTFSDVAMRAEREAAGLGALAAVTDPEVRAALTPQHPFGCKRPLLSNDFYPAFNRANVELVTDGIDHIDGDGVMTADGTHRPLDTLVYATGFETTQFTSAIDVIGAGGLRLADAWADGAQAHLGVTTTGFPNLFMLYGPNTNNGSILTMLEYQTEHVLALVRRMVAEGDWIDVRADAMATFNDGIQRDLDGVEVWQAGCNSYYRTPSGRIVTQWPHNMGEYGRRAATVHPDAFVVGSRP